LNSIVRETLTDFNTFLHSTSGKKLDLNDFFILQGNVATVLR